MNLTIELIDQTNMQSVVDFAASFEHELVPCEWPLYLVRKGVKMLGYFQAFNPLLIYPCIHPHCSPREVLEAARLVGERLKVHSEGGFGAMTPTETEFSPKIMRKLGFHPTNLLLYVDRPI